LSHITIVTQDGIFIKNNTAKMTNIKGVPNLCRRGNRYSCGQLYEFLPQKQDTLENNTKGLQSNFVVTIMSYSILN
jgi:hypothetical protein